MRFAWVLAMGALSACVSVGGVPAQTGMTISQHAATCTDGGRQIVSEFIGVLVGECTAKPDEYVRFTNGKISQVYTSEEISEAMLASCPAARLAECENDIRAHIAKRTETKWQIASDLYNAKSQRMANSLKSLSDQMIAYDSAGYASAPATSLAPSASGPLVRSYISGPNQICVYNVMGNATARTIPMGQLCPQWGN